MGEDAFVDGHVHVYPHVPLAAVLAAALANVGRALERADAAAAHAVLILADPSGVDGYGRLAALGPAGTRPPPLAGWSVAARAADAVRLDHDSGARVSVLRGRQLVTCEGLEVLVTGAWEGVRDGRTLAATLDQARARGGWATVAWGAGKWLGRRGRLVTQMIAAEGAGTDVALGDNGGRPWCWFRVPQFRAAAEHGMRVLAGSDPLPVGDDEGRIGSYGFGLRIDAAQPVGAALRAALGDRATEVRTLGRRLGAWRFVHNQVRLRAAPLRAP